MITWTRLPQSVRMWSPWWLRHVLAVERDGHNRTMQELREAEEATTTCTPKMLTEGARALDLWSDESLRQEIDARRMAELVWQAMAPHRESGPAAV